VAVLLLVLLLGVQVASAWAAGPEPLALGPQVVAQTVPTPTPFRFVTPTPFVFVPSPATTTPAPRAGGFPVEMAIPALGAGLAALGGGATLLRRRRS
jgi:hypothetical protein